MSPRTSGLLTDRSVSAITSGSGAATPVLAADTSRAVLILANPDVAIPIYVNMVGGTASAHAAGSIPIAPQTHIQFTTFVPTNAITAVTSGGTPGLTILTMP